MTIFLKNLTAMFVHDIAALRAEISLAAASHKADLDELKARVASLEATAQKRLGTVRKAPPK